MLGGVADAEYLITAAGPSPGSALALLTDGSVESASPAPGGGRAQHVRPLAAAAPLDAGRLADALLGDRRRGEDDVALLLLRYDGLVFRPIRSGGMVWRLSDAVMRARRFTARTLRSWDSTGGRGLFLVEAMSTAWGTVPVSGGKQVWSGIGLPPHVPPPTDTEPARGTTRPAPA